MKDNLKMVIKKERESFIMIIVIMKLESILIIRLMVKQYTTIKTEEYKIDNMRMAKEYINDYDTDN